MTEPANIWTHAALVDRAARWLLNSKRCKSVFQEPRPQTCWEHVDAIGWLPWGESIVVECKVSRADLVADHRKPWSRTSTGMGFWKYFMVPQGLLRSDDAAVYGALGALGGIGLLEVRGRAVKVVVESEPRQARDMAAEINLLLTRLP